MNRVMVEDKYVGEGVYFCVCVCLVFVFVFFCFFFFFKQKTAYEIRLSLVGSECV